MALNGTHREAAPAVPSTAGAASWVWTLGRLIAGAALAVALMVSWSSVASAEVSSGPGHLFSGVTEHLTGNPILPPAPATRPDEPAPAPELPVVVPVPDPVAAVVAPVTQTVHATVDPVVAAIVETVDATVTPVVDPVLQTVNPVVTPVLQTVDATIRPIVDPVLQTVDTTIRPIVDPVFKTVDTTIRPAITPVLETVDRTVNPIADQVVAGPVRRVDATIELASTPFASAPESDGTLTTTAQPVEQTTPAAAPRATLLADTDTTTITAALPGVDAAVSNPVVVAEPVPAVVPAPITAMDDQRPPALLTDSGTLTTAVSGPADDRQPPAISGSPTLPSAPTSAPQAVPGCGSSSPSTGANTAMTVAGFVSGTLALAGPPAAALSMSSSTGDLWSSRPAEPGFSPD